MRNPFLGFLLLASALALVCSGCWSAPKKVAREIPNLQLQWHTNVLRQAALPALELNWPAALARLETDNLKLRRARLEITNSQENVRQVFHDLLPTLDLHGSASHTLANISALSFDDVTFNIDSFINFPGIAGFSSSLFAARLSLMRARTAAALTEREQTIELYKLFLDGQELRETMADLAADEDLAARVARADRAAARMLQEDARARRLALDKQRASLQDAAAEMLGSREFSWAFLTNGWPVLDYPRKPLALADTNQVARLQIRLLAIELVGAWAQIQGIKLQYWPDLNLFITSPPIYGHGFGGDTFWKAGDVTATADFFWRVDTRGNISRQLRQTRRDQELQKARLRQESLTLIAKAVAARDLAASTQARLAQIQELMPLLGQLPPPQDFASILRAAETARSIREEERKLRRDLAEINTVFWFIDDAKWPQPGAEGS